MVKAEKNGNIVEIPMGAYNEIYKPLGYTIVNENILEVQKSQEEEKPENKEEQEQKPETEPESESESESEDEGESEQEEKPDPLENKGKKNK